MRTDITRWTKLGELEADVGRTEALYAAVTEEGRVAGEEGASLTVVRTRLEREMAQIGAVCVMAAAAGIQPSAATFTLAVSQ